MATTGLNTRILRPSYWTDHALHTRLTADQREFYQGLWMVADDAGYLVWDLAVIGGELYRYRTPAWRAKVLPGWARLLAGLEPDNPHLVVFECGHGLVPKVARYNSYGRPNYRVRDEHGKRCQGPASSTPVDLGKPRSTTVHHGKPRSTTAYHGPLTRRDEDEDGTRRDVDDLSPPKAPPPAPTAPPASALKRTGGAHRNGPRSAGEVIDDLFAMPATPRKEQAP